MPIVDGYQVPTVQEVTDRLLESFGQQAMLNGWSIQTADETTTLSTDDGMNYILRSTPQQVMGEVVNAENRLIGRYSYDLNDLSVRHVHIGGLPGWLVKPFEV